MRTLAFVIALLVGVSGCGSSGPNASTVKKHMAPAQLAIGEPIVNSIDMILVPIPAGQFQMGTAPKKGKKSPFGGSESPRHGVDISSPFYMSTCEVTQKQYAQIMDESPWLGQPLVQVGPNNAATYISWENATEFCRRLSKQEDARYRLPTEAEWEYCCRAGSLNAWHFGDDHNELTNYAWIDANAYKTGEQYAHAVGSKKPNGWALYDMHGNTWEWCQDFYAPYVDNRSNAKDPRGPAKGWVRVWRGGSFASAALNTRSATRISYGRVGYRVLYLAGFRVVKEMDTSPPQAGL